MYRVDCLAVVACSCLLVAGLGCGNDEASDDDDSPIAIDEDAGDAEVGEEADTGECIPESCESLEVECGEHDDGCGGTLECGECEGANAGCMEGMCVDECTPDTCEDLDAECGEQPDGCGGTLDCGECEAPNANCSEGMCECEPDTCEDVDAECGEQPDGCGGTLECGECSGENDECVDGVCECQPHDSCFGLDAECGEVDDGCGGTLECDECGSGEQCVDNQCEVDPETCEQMGNRCGGTRCCEGLICGLQSPSDGECRDRCCVPNGGSCQNDDDCCGTQSGNRQCVATPNCVNGTCCQGENAYCESDEDCCGSLTCGRSQLCG